MRMRRIAAHMYWAGSSDSANIAATRGPLLKCSIPRTQSKSFPDGDFSRV
jgi:hypothetical protein